MRSGLCFAFRTHYLPSATREIISRSRANMNERKWTVLSCLNHSDCRCSLLPLLMTSFPPLVSRWNWQFTEGPEYPRIWAILIICRIRSWYVFFSNKVLCPLSLEISLWTICLLLKSGSFRIQSWINGRCKRKYAVTELSDMAIDTSTSSYVSGKVIPNQLKWLSDSLFVKFPNRAHIRCKHSIVLLFADLLRNYQTFLFSIVSKNIHHIQRLLS